MLMAGDRLATRAAAIKFPKSPLRAAPTSAIFTKAVFQKANHENIESNEIKIVPCDFSFNPASPSDGHGARHQFSERTHQFAAGFMVILRPHQLDERLRLLARVVHQYNFFPSWRL